VKLVFVRLLLVKLLIMPLLLFVQSLLVKDAEGLRLVEHTQYIDTKE
jgi:hypothetical protein